MELPVYCIEFRVNTSYLFGQYRALLRSTGYFKNLSIFVPKPQKQWMKVNLFTPQKIDAYSFVVTFRVLISYILCTMSVKIQAFNFQRNSNKCFRARNIKLRGKCQQLLHYIINRLKCLKPLSNPYFEFWCRE